MQHTSNSSNTWSAEQYVKFEQERNRPVVDLLAHIPTKNVKRAVDIGCGPGNSTELLAAHYPDASIQGMDSSKDMINAARKRLPDVEFEVSDVSTWQGDGLYDVILANAVFQWVPDHETLFPALIKKLSPGGSLVVQMPDNFDEPTHQLMRAVATEGPWANTLAEAPKRLARESAEWYYKKLHNQVNKLDIWRTTYYHQLAGGPQAIVEWVKGTGLRPFIDPLGRDDREAYIAQYTAEIAKAYPVYADGSVLLPFPRLFIIATV